MSLLLKFSLLCMSSLKFSLFGLFLWTESESHVQLVYILKNNGSLTMRRSRVPASPRRVPASPCRVPASPRQVPASPRPQVARGKIPERAAPHHPSVRPPIRPRVRLCTHPSNHHPPPADIPRLSL